MEKLELLKKALPNYLNHKLKCEVTDNGIKKIVELSGIYINGECVFHDLVESEQGFDNIKPILHPLSDLIKVGVNLVNEHSINLLVHEKFNIEYGIFSHYKGHLQFELEGDSNLGYDSMKTIDYSVVDFVRNELLKAHYDLDGLIEKGLAIDINKIS